MSDSKPDPKDPPVSAEQLRMAMLQKEMEKLERDQKRLAEEHDKLSAFTEDFLRNQISEDEIAMVRRLVMQAVKDGKMEAMVYSFPSDLCTDRGRAINSSDPKWPETLQGKARQFFERYQEFGRPQGYRLNAMVINFPSEMPGDIGLFLSWAPPAH